MPNSPTIRGFLTCGKNLLVAEWRQRQPERRHARRRSGTSRLPQIRHEKFIMLQKRPHHLRLFPWSDKFREKPPMPADPLRAEKVVDAATSEKHGEAPGFRNPIQLSRQGREISGLMAMKPEFLPVGQGHRLGLPCPLIRHRLHDTGHHTPACWHQSGEAQQPGDSPLSRHQQGQARPRQPKMSHEGVAIAKKQEAPEEIIDRQKNQTGGRTCFRRPRLPMA